MNAYFNRLLTLACLCSAALVATSAQADPLAGRDLLKFEQKPMVNTAFGGAIYFGHDELSTAYGVGNTANPPLNYDGTFMADDFADNFSSPVVHVTWWGSYIDDNNAAVPPQPHVQKFLIAFESDIPAQPGGFSRPGTVLQHDVVTLGPLSPGSGTFTETLVRGPDPVLGEALYKYNAELHLGREFFEQKDTVYWLKIVALVDVPQPISPTNIPPGVTQWGWHNRDYTIQNTLASPNVTSAPFGEFIDGTVAGQNVYHFQDDSVQGQIRYTPGAPFPNDIVQLNPQPQNYVFVNSNGLGPVDGPMGIELKSKDLAFSLYTVVPEPTSCLLLFCGTLGLAAVDRRRRG
jgi:hypothetical protein